MSRVLDPVRAARREAVIVRAQQVARRAERRLLTHNSRRLR